MCPCPHVQPIFRGFDNIIICTPKVLTRKHFNLVFIYPNPSLTSRMQKKNAHLQETLAKMEQEHQLAITKLQQTHDERIAKMREHYVDFTHSILTLKDSTPGSSSSTSGSNTSSATSSNSSSGGGTGTSGSSGSSSSGSGSSKSKYVDKKRLYSRS